MQIFWNNENILSSNQARHYSFYTVQPTITLWFAVLRSENLLVVVASYAKEEGARPGCCVRLYLQEFSFVIVFIHWRCKGSWVLRIFFHLPLSITALLNQNTHSKDRFIKQGTVKVHSYREILEHADPKGHELNIGFCSIGLFLSLYPYL